MNSKTYMNVTNTSEGELHIYKGENIEVGDLRLGGYFHITRDSIQRCLHETFIFLNEEESQDYSCIQVIKILQMNSRLDIKKTTTDETEKLPGQSQILLRMIQKKIHIIG